MLGRVAKEEDIRLLTARQEPLQSQHFVQSASAYRQRSLCLERSAISSRWILDMLELLFSQVFVRMLNEAENQPTGARGFGCPVGTHAFACSTSCMLPAPRKDGSRSPCTSCECSLLIQPARCVVQACGSARACGSASVQRLCF